MDTETEGGTWRRRSMEMRPLVDKARMSIVAGSHRLGFLAHGISMSSSAAQHCLEGLSVIRCAQFKLTSETAALGLSDLTPILSSRVPA
eukprot:3350742-Rhodomonas_salina.1